MSPTTNCTVRLSFPPLLCNCKEGKRLPGLVVGLVGLNEYPALRQIQRIFGPARPGRGGLPAAENSCRKLQTKYCSVGKNREWNCFFSSATSPQRRVPTGTQHRSSVTSIQKCVPSVVPSCSSPSSTAQLPRIAKKSETTLPTILQK